jgi:hypothetical protein
MLESAAPPVGVRSSDATKMPRVEDITARLWE